LVNHLARRGRVQPRSELFGKALENYVFHELAAYLEYRDRRTPLSYWRLASGIEHVGRRIFACLEPRRRVREDEIEVLPIREFLAKLWEDEPF